MTCDICGKEADQFTEYREHHVCQDCHIRITDYADRLESRIERLEDRAGKARQSAVADQEQSRKMLDMVPFGQPILVGHHSEAGDRRHRERAHTLWQRGFDKLQRAAHMESRAASARKNRAVSSDDPAAVIKLREKLADREKLQEEFRRYNKAIRKVMKKHPDDKAAQVAMLVAELGCKESTAQNLLEPDFGGRYGIPAYRLRNNNSEIRRLKKRIEELTSRNQRLAEEPPQNQEIIKGVTIERDLEDNRLRLYFSAKPEPDVIKALKARGFRWAKSRKAWQRQLNNGAEYAMQQILDMLPPIPDGAVWETEKRLDEKKVKVLRSQAQTLMEAAQQARRRALARKTNTRRQFDHYTAALKRARNDMYLASVALGFCDAADANTLPNELAGITEKTQIETIVGLREFPDDGAARRRLERTGIRWKQYAQVREQLLSLGDAALKEPDDQERRDTALRNIMLHGIKDFYPTPEGIINAMMHRVNIRAGMRVLEPSAGAGHIADIIRQRYPEAELDIVEYANDLIGLLQDKGYSVKTDDIMDSCMDDKRYDVIIMNPPFSNNQDAKHVLRCWDLLAPGGRLVSVMADRGNVTNKYLSQLEGIVDAHGFTEAFPEGAFNSVGTNVRTKMVVLNKPDLPRWKRQIVALLGDHDEPDGTDNRRTVENRYGVRQGDDWLTKHLRQRKADKKVKMAPDTAGTLRDLLQKRYKDAHVTVRAGKDVGLYHIKWHGSTPSPADVIEIVRPYSWMHDDGTRSGNCGNNYIDGLWYDLESVHLVQRHESGTVTEMTVEVFADPPPKTYVQKSLFGDMDKEVQSKQVTLQAQQMRLL